MSLILNYHDKKPDISKAAFIASNTTIIGDVVLEEDVSIWFGTILRGDVMPIRIGARSNIQDLCMAHGTDGQFGVEIGKDVTVGHRAIVHGCKIGDGCLIGMGSIILDGCTIGDGAIVAAGAVVAPGTKVQPQTMVAGVPAKPIRDLSNTATQIIKATAIHYSDIGREYAEIKTPAKQ